KTLEERETRYNVFGEITGKRLVKTDSTTKSTDSWQEVTEYNNQGKVWKSNANNGVTRYYLYDRNGNATLQLDTTGTGITAKSADQLKDLTGVSYTETVYDKRNQVVEVREPKFNQDKLDTSLNLFNQTISRTVDKSTVSLTDSASKLSFNAETQKLSIQANAQAKRVMIKYWPKGSTATASNTFTVDMQATATAGLFVLDIGAIQANIEYSYSYSSSDYYGGSFESGTGAIKRSVNVVDVFSGGTVSAKPSVDINDIDYTFKGKAELINNKYILIKDLPKETSRVEVKYRVENLDNWGTLSYAAPFDSNYGGYLVNLNGLDTNTRFDYFYILYDSKGHILGGNTGLVHQNFLNQRDIFYDYYKDVIYEDKGKVINEKTDLNKSIWSLGGSVDSTIVSSSPLKIKYTFSQNGIRNYGDYVFSLFFKGKNGGFEKVTPNSYASRGEGNLDVIVEFTKDELDRIYNITEISNQGSKGFLDVKIGLFQDKKYIEIGSGVQNISINNNYWGPSYSLDGTSKISLKEKSTIRLTNQSINTTSSILYYRPVGSNNIPEDKYSGWNVVQAEPLYDIYGERVNGVFDVNLPYIKDGQKYEFQYISFNKMEVINRQNGILEPYGLWDGSLMILMSNIPLNYGGNGFVIPHQGYRINSGFAFFIPTISRGTYGPDYPTSDAKIQYRKVGTQEWIDSAAFGTWETGYLLWETADLADGDYEFKLKTYNTFEGESYIDDGLITETKLIGKIRKDFVLEVLEQWPSSLFENKITFSAQPAGSSKVTVKYGTAAGLLNKTAILTVGSDGKAILDATDLAEQNLLGSTTVYYSYETTDANGKLLNRATGYVNVGMGASSGQHTNQLNDSWLDFQPAQNNGSKMELFYRKRQVDASGNFVSDLVSADINSDAYWASNNQFQKVSITPSNGIYRWNLNDLVPTSGFENYEYFYQLYDSAGKAIAFVPGKLSIDSKGNGSSQQNKWVINGSGDRASQIVKSQTYNAFGEIISETDGNGNTSSLSYNTMGKLTKKVLPTVDIRKA
ncbi:hypothetical protein M211_3724, partial [Acinetobacter lactucae]